MTEDVTVFVPVLPDRVLKNAIGSSHGEVFVNLGLIDLTDEEKKLIDIKKAKLVFEKEEKVND